MSITLTAVMKPVSARILVVDDDRRTRSLLQSYLQEMGFQVSVEPDGTQLEHVLQTAAVDLLVLDLMLPGEDGLSLCRRLRGKGVEVPIIMLTAKGDDIDRIVGLELGADDYLPKPFTPRELVARVKAVLRRRPEVPVGAPSAHEGTVRFGPCELNLGTRSLARSGERLPITT